MSYPGQLFSWSTLSVWFLFLQSIECLVSILKCLVEWSRELYVHPGMAANSDTVGAESVQAAFPLGMLLKICHARFSLCLSVLLQCFVLFFWLQGMYNLVL